MHPDHEVEQFYTRSHLPGVPRPFHQLRPEERIDWGKRMEKAQFEAWAKLHHYDLVRCSHEPYAAYRSDLTNAALAGWRGANGEVAQSAEAEREEGGGGSVSGTRTLGDALPDEIKRVTGLIPIYASCGPVANIALMMMRASLDRATRALASGDIGEMMECLVDLQGYSA